MLGELCYPVCRLDAVDIYSSPERPNGLQLYQILVACSVFYCTLSISVLIVSSFWPLSVYLPVVMMLSSAFSVAHAMTQKHLCSTVHLIHQYYASSVGFLYGTFTFSCSVFLLSTAQTDTTWALKLLYYVQLALGLLWMYMWLAIIIIRVLKMSTIQSQGGGDFSVFLLLRCGCVPSDSKKMLLYSPLFFLGLFFSVESILTSALVCDMPLQSFCVVSGIILLFLSVLTFLLLNFKREMTSFELTQPEEEIFFVPRLTSAFGVLTLLRIVLIFGFVWGIIGYYWVISSGASCDDRILQVATFCYNVLLVSCMGGLFLSICCKLESCFPVRLNPHLFENDARSENVVPGIHLLTMSQSSNPFIRVLIMYCGFIVSNPDWYEVNEYNGWTNLLFTNQEHV